MHQSNEIKYPKYKIAAGAAVDGAFGYFVGLGVGLQLGLQLDDPAMGSMLNSAAPYINGRLVGGLLQTWLGKPVTHAGDYKHLIGRVAGAAVAAGVGYIEGMFVTEPLGNEKADPAARGAIGYVAGVATEEAVNKLVDCCFWNKGGYQRVPSDDNLESGWDPVTTTDVTSPQQ